MWQTRNSNLFQGHYDDDDDDDNYDDDDDDDDNYDDDDDDCHLLLCLPWESWTLPERELGW